MFATLKSLIPEPRQAEQPRHYIGRHRHLDPMPVPAAPAPATTPAGPQPTEAEPPAEGRDEIAAA